jgi:hypothetical protein
MPVFDLRENTIERTTKNSNVLCSKPFNIIFISLRDTKVALCHEIDFVFLSKLINLGLTKNCHWFINS